MKGSYQSDKKFIAVWSSHINAPRIFIFEMPYGIDFGYSPESFGDREPFLSIRTPAFSPNNLQRQQCKSTSILSWGGLTLQDW